SRAGTQPCEKALGGETSRAKATAKPGSQDLAFDPTEPFCIEFYYFADQYTPGRAESGVEEWRGGVQDAGPVRNGRRGTATGNGIGRISPGRSQVGQYKIPACI